MKKKLLMAALFSSVIGTSLPLSAFAAAEASPAPHKSAQHEQRSGHERHERNGRHDRHEHRGMQGDKALGLSREQKKDIHALRGEAMQNRQKIIDKYLGKLPAAEQKAMQDELAENRKQSEQAIRSKLNAEQQKKFDQMQEQKQARRSEAGKAKAQPEAAKAE